MTDLKMDAAKKYAALYVEITKDEAELKKKCEELDAIGDVVRQNLIDAQVDNVPIDIGGQRISVHLRTDTRPKLRDGVLRPTVAAALKKCGMGSLVKNDFNLTSLGTVLRERLSDGKAMPPSLEPLIEMLSITKVQASVAGASNKGARAARAAKESAAAE